MNLEERQAWQQHYPTYQFHDRDIVLSEYGFSAERVASEEKLFLTTSNWTLVLVAGASSLAVGKIEQLYKATEAYLPATAVFSMLLVVLLLISFFTLLHFAERQKTILFAKRKMVVLRKMLGLDFGNLQLVLPNWRLEGATQPFAVKIFPGWFTFAAYPLWIVGTFSSFVLFVLLARYFRQTLQLLPGDVIAYSLLVSAGWFLVLSVFYRWQLYDAHENLVLSLSQLLASVLGVRLVESVEYTLYRARLAVFEMSRLGYETVQLEMMAVSIEDKSYFDHHGISFRGIARSCFNIVAKRKFGGGSTITQQFVRTLFIRDHHLLIRRKLVEILMAIWITGKLSKRELLAMYIAAVRYDHQVFGLPAAMGKIIGRPGFSPTLGECFFLIERIGNIRNKVLSRRIDSLLANLVEEKKISREDAISAVRIYEDKVTRKILQPDDEESFGRLVKSWQ